MSNNSDEQYQQQQQQQQHQQQQQIPTQPFSMMNFYSQQPYQSSQYSNSPFSSNLYYGGNAYSNQLNMNEPSNYYQQQQQLFNPHQPIQQQQIYTPQTTLQQFNGDVIPTEPDEFITDLLKKPQERLFLLKIELELEAFIKDDKKLRLDFPNMNSYQRLMIHRLAPYYKLNHYHDAMRKGVYVCKTFITELPSVRLPDIDTDTKTEDNTDASSTSATGNNSIPQFKIMRREPGSSGSSPRSATNLNANNNADEQAKADRKNMTYEERKTAYEEARARIFQN